MENTLKVHLKTPEKPGLKKSCLQLHYILSRPAGMRDAFVCNQLFLELKQTQDDKPVCINFQSDMMESIVGYMLSSYPTTD